MQIFTIGHSNHTFEKFVGLLEKHDIDMLIDVRSKPHSRFAHFGRDSLARNLRANGIDYRWAGRALGGLSHLSVTDALFTDKMQLLVEMANEGTRLAMMCSEGKPCECHRAGKLTAWLHRNHPEIETRHITADGTLLDAREYEPQVLDEVMWHEFKATLFNQAGL